jgi:hypothetical protein
MLVMWHSSWLNALIGDKSSVPPHAPRCYGWRWSGKAAFYVNKVSSVVPNRLGSHSIILADEMIGRQA